MWCSHLPILVLETIVFQTPFMEFSTTYCLKGRGHFICMTFDTLSFICWIVLELGVLIASIDVADKPVDCFPAVEYIGLGIAENRF